MPYSCTNLLTGWKQGCCKYSALKSDTCRLLHKEESFLKLISELPRQKWRWKSWLCEHVLTVIPNCDGHRLLNSLWHILASSWEEGSSSLTWLQIAKRRGFSNKRQGNQFDLCIIFFYQQIKMTTKTCLIQACKARKYWNDMCQVDLVWQVLSG